MTWYWPHSEGAFISWMIIHPYVNWLPRTKPIMEKEAHIFPVADALMYIQTGGNSGQGSNFLQSKNPDFGATFTYYLKEVPKP